MFTISKNARIHESIASSKYSTAEVAAMTKEAGTKFYGFPFNCPVLGCGDVPPDEYDQTSRARFTMDDDYDDQQLLSNVDEIIKAHGLKLVTTAINRGIDLELRAKARPTPKAKMSDNDKMAYIIGNHSDAARDLIGQDQAAWVKWFDENIG